MSCLNSSVKNESLFIYPALSALILFIFAGRYTYNSRERNDFMKKLVSLFLFLSILVFFTLPSRAEESPDCSAAKSVILTEQLTGQVLFEENADEKLPVASVTKIMTLLIAAEEIEAGNLAFSDTAACSSYAASMDGSVIWLVEGEEMTVHDLIKSIVIASANDACVMLAEHIAGSEPAFVKLMNEKAAALGMANTRFANCVGYDDENHYSTARDVTKMAAQLRKYSYFDDFLLTRLDSVRTGTKTETQLLNTNKLITSYSGITGLKTGTTDGAGCCFCASAKRGETELIAVVLGCSKDEERFETAETLLDYGFGGFELVTLRPDVAELLEVSVDGGIKKNVDTRFSGVVSVILPKGSAKLVEYHYSRTQNIAAPVEKGDQLGFVTMTVGEQVVGTAKIIAAETVEKLDFPRCFRELLSAFFRF